MTNDLVLAFSGGLDTTFCAAWLAHEKGYRVHAVTVDTGGFSPAERQRIEARARQAGVASFTLIDGTGHLYGRILRHLIAGNVLKNGTYPLSVSAERITQAVLIAEHARSMGATAIAHGSTGAGNDQVRFDMLFAIALPGVEVITPIRDLRLSREAEIAWLDGHGIHIDATKAAYSINQGIWGTSVGGRETLTSDTPLPEPAWPTPLTREGTATHVLTFTEGELTGLDGEPFTDRVAAIRALQEKLAGWGIGRDIHVGDTIIGIKGRVGFEAPAPLVIIKAHHALEKHVLTKWQLFWKDQLAQWYGNWLHEGQYFDPVMRDIEAFFARSQRTVSGDVIVSVAPHRFHIDGIRSPHDLMAAQEGAYGEMNNGWTGDDVKGFARIFGNQVGTWHKVHARPVEQP
ncbi:MAG: argininosuccinate synthase [Bacteroidetes bacterium]|nr:argininosuccinate synthase [Bacteroidota bacterium]